MIFAMADCLAYLAERGRYSPTALAAGGWNLVTPETLAAAEEAPPATIFVIHPRRSMVSWMVMYGTNSPASHTALYLGGGYVCDATPQGTMIRPLSDVLSERTWFTDNRRQPISEEARARIVESAVKMVGTPYGWFTVVLLAWMHVAGLRPDSHLRLWGDAALLLALPALIVEARSKRVDVRLVSPAIAYICVLGSNRIKRWATGRVDALVEREIERRRHGNGHETKPNSGV